MFCTRSVPVNPDVATFLSYDVVILEKIPAKLMSADKEARTRQLDRLNKFLADVERKAFRMAQLATGNTDHALDIVQDAMLTLSKNYLYKDQSEWGALFHRILQNRIKDWYRSQSVRHRIFDWFGLSMNNEETEADPIQTAPDRQGHNPAESLDNEELNTAINEAVQKLPLRQQQAFLLRNWEGMSVKQTALAMNCSEGSVKTHYSRATKSLQQQLEAYNYEA